MFGFQRNVKKELNELWTEIYKIQNFQTKIENAVPTFNKVVESQKEMNLYIKGTTKLLQKIIKHIKLPEVKKNDNETKTRKSN